MNIARLFRALAMIAATLVTTCVLSSQTDRGSIQGTIKDTNGAVVSDAQDVGAVRHLGGDAFGDRRGHPLTSRQAR